jgi:hypothetical protein
MTPQSKVRALDRPTRVCLTYNAPRTEEYRRSIEVDGELTWVGVVSAGANRAVYTALPTACNTFHCGRI